MQSAGSTDAADESIGPSAHKKRGPQDDNAKQTAAVAKDVDVFRAFVKADQRLSEIHVHYEQQLEYPLTKVEKAGEKLDYRVEKMKLSKDKTSLIYNQFLSLSGIPSEPMSTASATALSSTGSSISTNSQPTNAVASPTTPTAMTIQPTSCSLIGQVITVSLETVKIVNTLPELGISEISTAQCDI